MPPEFKSADNQEQSSIRLRSPCLIKIYARIALAVLLQEDRDRLTNVSPHFYLIPSFSIVESPPTNFTRLTYQTTKVTYKKTVNEVTAYYWKVTETKIFQIITTTTFLTSSKEVVGVNKHRRLISIHTKKIRQNLDTGTPSSINPSICKTLEDTNILETPLELFSDSNESSESDI
ncbi:hypothetical protein PCASD_12909 [Puccinia coronata f. sp. avenae]|uniref:Uncharacterized protein n=1 Tax=Puccinia coronata f. sp. avenae TaxID=200324 RepID=A0A2N5U5J2_9BASI|nr:hypothetical protein PCASD_12909 [Puccinia coronata f. sp. avenae]